MLVILIVVQFKDKGGNEKMGIVIGKMVVEDLLFQVEIDEDFGEIIFKGMGEFYLDIKVDIFKCIYGVDFIVGQFQVVYCEIIM